MKTYILALDLLDENLNQEPSELMKLAQLHPKILSTNNQPFEKHTYNRLLGENIKSFFSLDKVNAVHVHTNELIEIKTPKSALKVSIIDFNRNFGLYFKSLEPKPLNLIDQGSLSESFNELSQYILHNLPEGISADISKFLMTCPKYRVSKEETFEKYLPTEIITEKMLGVHIPQLSSEQIFNFGQILAAALQNETVYKYAEKILYGSNAIAVIINYIANHVILFLKKYANSTDWVAFGEGFAIVEVNTIQQHLEVLKIQLDDDEFEIKFSIDGHELFEIEFKLDLTQLMLNNLVFELEDIEFRVMPFGPLWELP